MRNGKQRRRVTMKEIARAAGVSVATVSNVLAGTGRCSAETRERVEAIIKELGFVPDAAARNLKRGRSGTLGVLFPTLGRPGRLENPFYWEFLSAVEAEARQRGYHVLMAQTELDDDLAFAIEQNLDGLIILGAYDDFPVVQRALALGVPVVLVDSYVDAPCLQVRIDDFGGGYLAARHLLELGHRRVGLLTGARRDRGVSALRAAGFRQALEEAGVTLPPAWDLECDVSFEGARRTAGDLLDSPDPPTGLFASADTMACGVLAAARERGVAVPSALSVVGFDDVPLAQYTAPPLTTVRQQTHRKGTEAVRLIAEGYVRGEWAPQVVQIGVELVARGSTAAAPL